MIGMRGVDYPGNLYIQHSNFPFKIETSIHNRLEHPPSYLTGSVEINHHLNTKDGENVLHRRRKSS